MAKMFYSLEETAEKLGMTEDQVRDLAKSGQLEEFKDGDKLVFKASQVDLLAGGDEQIALADSGELEPVSLSSSQSASAMGASGLGMGDSREQTGISIFDPEETEQADPAAQTQMMAGGDAPDFDMDAAASGSGLYDLTRESDDTSLGADLLEDVYASDETGSTAGQPAVGSESGVALFEDTTTSPGGAPAGAVVIEEAYDGAWSGLLGGLAFGATVILLVALALMILSWNGLGAATVLGGLADSNMTLAAVVAGGGAGLMLIGAIVGWLMLRNS